MGNGFFNNHPGLGSVFDFNHDGNMNLGEAGAMGALGNMAASELMRASEESDRERDYDFEPCYSKGKKDSDYEDLFDDDYDEYDEDRVYEVDYSNQDEVYEAIISGDFDEADCEYLAHSALCDGVRFDEDQTEEILERIRDRRLRDWLEDPIL